MRRVLFFMFLVAATLVVEASLIRHPRATTVVPGALLPASVEVRPLKG